MTTISPGRKLITLINVFTVEPENQQQLLELLARATETSVRHAPGFISASLHRCLDGTKVTMYAQWRSVEDYQAMRDDRAALSLHRAVPRLLAGRGKIKIAPCLRDSVSRAIEVDRSMIRVIRVGQSFRQPRPGAYTELPVRNAALPPGSRRS
jgi:quinol monooxygenase YgiN